VLNHAVEQLQQMCPELVSNVQIGAMGVMAT
jgi:hypothetical protein